MTTDDFDQLIERYHQALVELNKDTALPGLDISSKRDDISLANPISAIARGRKLVEQTAGRYATNLREVATARFENITKHVIPELAFIVDFERCSSKVGGS